MSGSHIEAKKFLTVSLSNLKRYLSSIKEKHPEVYKSEKVLDSKIPWIDSMTLRKLAEPKLMRLLDGNLTFYDYEAATIRIMLHIVHFDSPHPIYKTNLEHIDSDLIEYALSDWAKKYPSVKSFFSR